jgi:hypothetical protein
MDPEPLQRIVGLVAASINQPAILHHSNHNPRSPPAMSTAVPRTTARLTAPATLSWLALAVIGLSLAGWLLRFWTGQPESADHVLILIGAGWLWFRTLPAIRQMPRRPSAVGLLLIALAAILVPTAWYLYALVGLVSLALVLRPRRHRGHGRAHHRAKRIATC